MTYIIFYIILAIVASLCFAFGSRVGGNRAHNHYDRWIKEHLAADRHFFIDDSGEVTAYRPMVAPSDIKEIDDAR